MPHQCTACGRQFDDGSKEMLSGCPECGGNKFQFLPASKAGESAPEPPESPEMDSASDRSVARTVGNAATAVRDLVGSSPDGRSREPAFEESDESVSPPPDQSAVEPSRSAASEPSQSSAGETGDGTAAQPTRPETTPESMAETEDDAQASARSDVISPEELPPAPQQDSSTADDPANDHPDSADRPGLSELRAELNQQFESIKVLEPGQYELNLMELFDREEYIVALQEDGKYTVQVPEKWKK